MPSGGPATGRNASAKGSKSCFQTVRDRYKLRDVMATDCSSILAAAERQQPSRFVHARATSPLKTRVLGFRQSPPGRLSRRDRRRREIATGSRGCRYKTASGRHEWPNRDPLGEKTDRNLYRFVMNNALSYFDPYGLDLIGLPGLTRYQLVPQPPPLQLPPPPIPPGVNVPPPCAPYPECAHPPSSHIPGSYSQCLDWCSNKLKTQSSLTNACQTSRDWDRSR